MFYSRIPPMASGNLLPGLALMARWWEFRPQAGRYNFLLERGGWSIISGGWPAASPDNQCSIADSQGVDLKSKSLPGRLIVFMTLQPFRFVSAHKLSGSAVNSLFVPSGRQTMCPSSRMRTIFPRNEPRSVFTRSPGFQSAVSDSDSSISTIASHGRTPAM